MSTSSQEEHPPGRPPGRHLLVTDTPEEPGSGVLVGQDVQSGQGVWLPDAVRPRGVTVIGKTGTGKSTLLEQLLVEDLRRGTPAVVIDPHGRLAARVLSLAPREALDRLLLLEPWPDRPFHLNLLDCPDPGSDIAVDRTVDHAVEVFKKLFDRAEEYLPRLERDLDAAIRTAMANHGTLLDVLRLFGDPQLRSRYRAAVSDEAVHEYWDYFERLGREAERARQVEATVNRLYKLLAPKLIRHVVDSSTTTVPFAAVLAGDRMLLLSIPPRDLTPKRCDFLGALFLGALTDRIFAREAALADPPRLHLYIDEFARFATPMTAELFAEGRKYGVGLTVAHQTLAQLTDEAIRAAERQAGAVVFFQLIGPDAEELAGELDTTPVRTKTVVRQRTQPRYKEWDEQVWDDRGTAREHEELQATLANLIETVGKPLARRKAAYYILEAAYDSAGWFMGTPGPAFEALLSGNTDQVSIHLPFNPSKYAWFGVQPGQTVGGLQRVGEPDFWNPDFPEELRTYICEAYVLHQEGSFFFPGFPGFEYKIDGLCSRLNYEVRKFISTDSEIDPIKKLMNEHRQDLEPLADGEVRDVARELDRQTAAVDKQHFKEALFWFCPCSQQLADNWSSCWGSAELTREREAEIAAETGWLQSTRPQPGQERGVRYRYERYHADDEEPHVRFLTQWPQLGCWQVTVFPHAVAWLTQWVRDARRDIVGLQAQWDAHRPLEERIRHLVQTHFTTVHRKEYRGEVPSMNLNIWVPPERSRHFLARDRYGRLLAPPPEPITSQEPWYDPVEELDQTHADRRLELANELVRLPAYTAYYRTVGTQQHVALTPPVRANIDEPRIERIRQASKARFGRPPGSPKPSARPAAPKGPGDRPAGPRIARHPSEE